MGDRWVLVARNDTRARLLADRHYSRKHPGANEFCPPGNNIVLIIPDGICAAALWVSHRPDPKANLAMPRADGMDYWDNPFFRNESDYVASELIAEALQITVGIWCDGLPKHGFHSFVDSKFVKPVMRRGKPVYGWVFQKAGFRLSPVLTQNRKLYRWIYSKRKLQVLQPIQAGVEQLSLGL